MPRTQGTLEEQGSLSGSFSPQAEPTSYVSNVSSEISSQIVVNLSHPHRQFTGLWQEPHQQWLSSVESHSLADYVRDLLGKYSRSQSDSARLHDLESRVDRVERAIATSTVMSALNTLKHSNLELRRPIAISVDLEEDEFVVARWTEALLEGEGKTQPQAIQDLREQIVDAYEDLRRTQEDGVELVEQAEELWSLLTEFVSPRA